MEEEIKKDALFLTHQATRSAAKAARDETLDVRMAVAVVKMWEFLEKNGIAFRKASTKSSAAPPAVAEDVMRNLASAMDSVENS